MDVSTHSGRRGGTRRAVLTALVVLGGWAGMGRAQEGAKPQAAGSAKAAAPNAPAQQPAPASAGQPAPAPAQQPAPAPAGHAAPAPSPGEAGPPVAGVRPRLGELDDPGAP